MRALLFGFLALLCLSAKAQDTVMFSATNIDPDNHTADQTWLFQYFDGKDSIAYSLLACASTDTCHGFFRYPCGKEVDPPYYSMGVEVLDKSTVYRSRKRRALWSDRPIRLRISIYYDEGRIPGSKDKRVMRFRMKAKDRESVMSLAGRVKAKLEAHPKGRQANWLYEAQGVISIEDRVFLKRDHPDIYEEYYNTPRRKGQ